MATRKKRRSKKVSSSSKSKPSKKTMPKVNSDAIKYKAYDVVKVTNIGFGDNKPEEEIRVLLPTAFDRDLSKISSWPSLIIDKGSSCKYESLYFLEDDVQKVENVTEQYKVSLIFEGGLVNVRATRKRKSGAK